MKLSTQQKNRGRNFNGAALELAASSSLHPIGWRRVTGQQSIAAHIRIIKECAVRMRFFLARKISVLGIIIQHAANSEVPSADVVTHYREHDAVARTSCLGIHQSIRATCQYPENRKKGSAASELHKESDLRYSGTRDLKPADPCLAGLWYRLYSSNC